MANEGRQQSLKLLITVSSGSGSGTITNSWDICRRIRIIPVSESTTYAMTINDSDGHLIFDSADTGDVLTGTLSTTIDLSLGIAKTVNISSSSQDGTFTVKFDMH